MKDLEKIKSEDLGCQVQDANPGNFAIEHEVAALVGATLPAPTEPSADDARELGAQLLVFLRRALLPIRSALRTAVAAIYAHLDSRCTDYTPAAYAPYIPRPYDPMRPFVPRTLPNLLQAITAFSARKISNGSAPSDGIPDGVSLAHLLCDASIVPNISELVDDNRGWTFTDPAYITRLCSALPSLRKLTLGFNKVYGKVLADNSILAELNMPAATDIDIRMGYYDGAFYNPPFDVVLPSTRKITSSQYTFNAALVFVTGAWSRNVKIPRLEELSQSSVAIVGCYSQGEVFNGAKLFIGCCGKPTQHIIIAEMQGGGGGNTNMIDDVEIGDYENIAQGIEPRWQPRQRLTFINFNNLTAENIVNHIFDRLADNSDGDPITINIGSTNLAKLTDEQKAIAQNKNYTLA